MTGTNKTTTIISATGNSLIDGVLTDTAWGDSTITYAFPTSASSYSYGPEKNVGFAAVSNAQINAALFTLEQSYGSAANDGFSVEGFTNVSFASGDSSSANIRLAQSDHSDIGTAYANMPWEDYAPAGDVWFGTEYDYRNPVAGSYAWHTVIHEIGHALGLKHGHETDGFGALPSAYDSLEYSAMTYRGYVGDTGDSYTYEEYGAPQTFMMADIAALQEMYGADYTTNSGNTVYTWRPTSGQTTVDGEVAISPGTNRILATIWDGDGNDTFDLTAYSDNLKIDLRPGKASLFSEDQVANLGTDADETIHFARGNIFNALLHDGDIRSLIENAKGGSGSDRIIGNQVGNSLQGYSGNDTLNGEGGSDVLIGASGADRLSGGTGADRLYGGAGADDLIGGADADMFLFKLRTESTVSASGRDTIFDFSASQGDRIDLSVIDANSKATSNQAFAFLGNAAFTGAAAELRYVKGSSDTYVYGDVNGDKAADFAVHLDDALTLQKSYFIL
ncbi:M10 family metallopeptidase [Rhizobium giardinii]|uniref:Serralysin n=1 Tax=Rhizobium giardinii TaxID=56731 RepID=A0A7W8UGH2_9HYPH|nr:M10 family metallopeptidase [Rhizobium giardinii]MBB5538122.1 serralysin [Rhizobium giardinii]